MKAVKKKVSDITVDELKTIIHEVIAEDIEAWRETFEIIADKKLITQIKQAGVRDKFIGAILSACPILPEVFPSIAKDATP